VLNDLDKVNGAVPEGKMKAPELLIAMAKERHAFFKEGRTNPAIAALVQGMSHARH
jgi:hypothetical protein